MLLGFRLSFHINILVSNSSCSGRLVKLCVSYRISCYTFIRLACFVGRKLGGNNFEMDGWDRRRQTDKCVYYRNSRRTRHLAWNKACWCQIRRRAVRLHRLRLICGVPQGSVHSSAQSCSARIRLISLRWLSNKVLGAYLYADDTQVGLYGFSRPSATFITFSNVWWRHQSVIFVMTLISVNVKVLFFILARVVGPHYC